MSELVKAIIASAVFSSICTAIAQILIQHFYAQKLEKFKAQLQAEASEREIKQARVFEIQAQVVATIYEKLWNLSCVSKRLIENIQANDLQKLQLSWVAYDDAKKDLEEYFFPKAIYIRENTADIIRQYIYKIEALSKLNREKTHVEFVATNYPETRKQLEEVGIKTDALEKNTAEILRLIYADFQELLGLETPTQPQANKKQLKT